MIKICKVLSQGYRKLKNIKPESWVEVPSSSANTFIVEEIPGIIVKDYRDIKRTYKRGLEG